MKGGINKPIRTRSKQLLSIVVCLAFCSGCSIVLKQTGTSTSETTTVTTTSSETTIPTPTPIPKLVRMEKTLLYQGDGSTYRIPEGGYDGPDYVEEYDEEGRVISSINVTCRVDDYCSILYTDYTYNADGDCIQEHVTLKEESSYEGSAESEYVVEYSYEYDENNQLIRKEEIIPEYYDSICRATVDTHNQALYEYDENNRVSKLSYINETTYVYDESDTSLNSWKGTTYYEYDENDRVIKDEYSVDQITGEQKFRYGGVEVYSYEDELLVKKQEYDGEKLVTEIDYEYSPKGLKTKETYTVYPSDCEVNGRTVNEYTYFIAYQYDENDRLFKESKSGDRDYIFMYNDQYVYEYNYVFE